VRRIRRFHRVRIHDDVRHAHENLLLIGESHHVLLRGSAERHQRHFLRVRRQLLFGREQTLIGINEGIDGFRISSINPCAGG
jgi:hypothetical protein